MTEYGKLYSRIWSDPEFVALDARPQQLYCLLISYSTRNFAGVLPLTLKRWAKSTGDGTVDNVTDALKSLVAARFVAVDWDSEELLVRTYIRNDEVYRQPNLLKSALKSACQVESKALRWVLHDELSRLPTHKEADITERVAKELVNGVARTLPEGFGEPFQEPFPEGMGEPPGVGGYLRNQEEHPHQHPSPAPAAAPQPAAADEPPPRPRSMTYTEMAGGRERPPEPDPGRHVVTARALVKRIISTDIPLEDRGQLVNRSARLLENGTDPALVEAALELWMTKPQAGPGLLSSLVSEVIKLRNGHTTGQKHKMRNLAELAAQERANEQQLATARKELT